MVANGRNGRGKPRFSGARRTDASIAGGWTVLQAPFSHRKCSHPLGLTCGQSPICRVDPTQLVAPRIGKVRERVPSGRWVPRPDGARRMIQPDRPDLHGAKTSKEAVRPMTILLSGAEDPGRTPGEPSSTRTGRESSTPLFAQRSRGLPQKLREGARVVRGYFQTLACRFPFLYQVLTLPLRRLRRF